MSRRLRVRLAVSRNHSLSCQFHHRGESPIHMNVAARVIGNRSYHFVIAVWRAKEAQSGPTNTKPMKPIRNMFVLLALALASLTTTHAQTPPPAAQPSGGFSFAVYGDSRSMMYLPPKSDQRA